MIRRTTVLSIVAFVLALVVPLPAAAADEECELEPRTACFGIESVEASLSTTQAGDHPDITFKVAVKKDPKSPKNVFGLHNSYATTRDIRINLPPGLIGDPNVLGVPQQCTVQELITSSKEGGGNCPNGAQIGRATITGYGLAQKFVEPLYMMQPPGGDVVARVGTFAGLFPTFIDLRVRSEGDYGLVAEVRDATPAERLVELDSTLWGVPADPSHDTERCTIAEALKGCVASLPRPPGSRQLAFLTNPTRCGVPLQIGFSASSWSEPERIDENEVKGDLATIDGCNSLPFGPSLTALSTSRHTSLPTGLDMTIKLPQADGVNVLEPAQTRDIRIDLPEGIAINPGAADGLAVCSVEQVHFKERVSAECPDAAKMASTEFEIGGLPRRMKGAIYLREPEPGNLFRIWVVADDLGAHVKLPGQLELDKETGQIKSVVLDAPQAPLREVRLLFKSGFRAPLMTPANCGTYFTHYEFTSWAGGSPAQGNAPMTIDEGCNGGGFDPELIAGARDLAAGKHSPFLFTMTREDGEQNPASFDISLPRGFAATLAGIPHCVGIAAETGVCPADSRLGKTIAAVGAGPNPLWTPQSGKDPTAIYLGGPYKDAPLSIVAVVPAQAGPFDLGDVVVRSAIYLNRETAQATAKTDPLPQIIEGIPITYKTIHVALDRPGFSLNPTSCAPKQTTSTIASVAGALAHPTARFRAVECSRLPFKPKLSFRLSGGTHRGSHPKLKATVRMPSGGANIATTSVALPHSEFIEQAHFKTICTRVKFAAKACPAGSIYGTAVAKTPLLDEPLEGPVYLRSSSNLLPDVVIALKGPPSLPIEIDVVGRVDSVKGGLRTTFDAIPDAPVSEFTLKLQGGKKGLFVNSTNLCASTYRAVAKFTGQNGKTSTLHPALQNSCKKSKKK